MPSPKQMLRELQRLFDINADLIDRLDRIGQNPRLTSQMKRQNGESVRNRVLKNISLMRDLIVQSRLNVSREYKKLQTQRPLPVEEMEMLKNVNEELRNLSQAVLSQRSLAAAPIVPDAEPWLGSLPNVPKTKPLMDKTTFKHFVNTATKTRSWARVVHEIEKYAKERHYSPTDVTEMKKEVVNELSRLRTQQLGARFEGIFGKKPRDLSEPGDKPKPSGPRHKL